MDARSSWNRFFNRPVPNFVLRLCVMFAGQACIALAIAVSRATGLGTSVISSPPAVLSFFTTHTIGEWTLVMNLGFVALQVVLLRRRFKPMQLFAVPVVFVFSALIDAFVPWAEGLPMPNYAVCLLFCVASCPVTALGVWLQVKAALVMLPGDGLVQAISSVARQPVHRCKLAFDITMVVCAAAISLATMGGLFGVREGTVLSAAVTGPIMGLYERVFGRIGEFMPVEGHISFIPQD